MKERRKVRTRFADLLRWRTRGCAVLGLLCVSGIALAAQDKKELQNQGDAGLIVNAHATAKEVGLPIYPGARPHKDEDDNSQAAQLGVWGSSFGFKLVVLKMESDDAPDKIAMYYRKELARYGKVLDCSNVSASSDEKEKGKSSRELTCDDDKPERGGQVFKAGTKEKQHVVGIQPNGKGSLFQLVYLQARGEQKPL